MSGDELGGGSWIRGFKVIESSEYSRARYLETWEQELTSSNKCTKCSELLLGICEKFKKKSHKEQSCKHNLIIVFISVHDKISAFSGKFRTILKHTVRNFFLILSE